MVAQNYSHLHRFYATDRGRLAETLIAGRLTKLAPPPPVRPIENDPRMALAIGYATPFLPMLSQYVPRVVHFHLTDTPSFIHKPPPNLPPDSPPDSPSAFALTGEALPLLPASLDLVLVAHALECLPSGADANMVWDECWRVLKGEGVLIVIVAHRPSGWEKIFLANDAGDGVRQRGVTMTKLKHALGGHGFHIEASGCALILPPMRYAIYRHLAAACESLPVIAQLGGLFGGVAMVVARKTLFAPHLRPGLAWRRPRFAQVSGVASPTARTRHGEDAGHA